MMDSTTNASSSRRNTNGGHERTPLVSTSAAQREGTSGGEQGEVRGGPPPASSTAFVSLELGRIEDTDLDRARLLLYVSHFFAQFSERAWQFSLTLFLAAFTDYESLALVSTYGLLQGLSMCMLGATTGRFVDATDRLFAARLLIWTENACVLVATAFCCLLLLAADDRIDDEEEANLLAETSSSWIGRTFRGVPRDGRSIAYLIGIHVFGSVASILDQGFLVAIERDWVVTMSHVAAAVDVVVVVVAHGEDVVDSEEDVKPITPVPSKPNKAWLSETNVAMKRIDLTCKVLAPAIAGFVIGIFDRDEQPHYGNDLTGAAILVGVVNVASLAVEWVCTAKIYRLVPSLEARTEKQPKLDGSVDGAFLSGDEDNVDAGPSNSTVMKESRCALWKLPHGLSVYLQQPIAWAGQGLAMLYLNALTFGALMTAYLVWRGMRLETVGIWRGVSAAVGIVGTFVYHYSIKRTTVVATGMWSIWYQFACLSLSFFSLFVDSFDVSMAMLVIGVCASRIGLWVFDISVTQLMQEFVPDGVRGVVGGTQQALNAFFSLLTFALGLAFPDPKEFRIYAAAGYSAVGFAAVVYAFGVFRKRDEFLLSSEFSASSS